MAAACSRLSSRPHAASEAAATVQLIDLESHHGDFGLHCYNIDALKEYGFGHLGFAFCVWGGLELAPVAAEIISGRCRLFRNWRNTFAEDFAALDGSLAGMRALIELTAVMRLVLDNRFVDWLFVGIAGLFVTHFGLPL
jgi:hypothetical protein